MRRGSEPGWRWVVPVEAEEHRSSPSKGVREIWQHCVDFMDLGCEHVLSPVSLVGQVRYKVCTFMRDCNLDCWRLACSAALMSP